jgi:hypothetical protein
VVRHRPRADLEGTGDGEVGVTPGREREHLTLPRRQLREREVTGRGPPTQEPFGQPGTEDGPARRNGSDGVGELVAR